MEDHLSLQFRQESFTSHKLMSGITKKLIVAGVSACLLSLLSYVTLHQVVQYKTKALSSQIDEFIQQHQNQIPHFQEKITKLDPSLISKIKFIKRAFGKDSKSLGYFEAPPRVHLIVEQLSKQLAKFEALDLKSFEFELVEFPTFEQPQASYIGKLSLIIKSPSYEAVKAFYTQIVQADFVSKEQHDLSQIIGPLDDYQITVFTQALR